jgi:hypothetical protein
LSPPNKRTFLLSRILSIEARFHVVDRTAALMAVKGGSQMLVQIETIAHLKWLCGFHAEAAALGEECRANRTQKVSHDRVLKFRATGTIQDAPDPPPTMGSLRR